MKIHDYTDPIHLPKNLYNKIEGDVVDLFVKLKIQKYPINPIDIALSLGYKLIPFSEMNKQAMQFLVTNDVDGISYYDPNIESFIIYYRSNVTNERLRFTIGHEIGHIRMGHKGESKLARLIADYYSAYLLAPTPWIGKARCKDYTDVANTFIISNPCATRCFTRYENWCNIPLIKDYEITLIDLLSKE